MAEDLCEVFDDGQIRKKTERTQAPTIKCRPQSLKSDQRIKKARSQPPN